MIRFYSEKKSHILLTMSLVIMSVIIAGCGGGGGSGAATGAISSGEDVLT